MRRAAQSLSPTSWPRCGSASKRSLRSAHFPIGAQWRPDCACGFTCAGAFALRSFALWRCNVFVLARLLFNAFSRQGLGFIIVSERQACTYRFAEEKMRQVLGAPSCCCVVHPVYFGSRSFRRWVGLVVSHTVGAGGTHPCVRGSILWVLF